MAYSKDLAVRVSSHLDQMDPPELISKKMFGGVGYMVQGNMACGVLEDKLIVRVGKPDYEEMLSREDTLPFDTTGRPMTGWVMVASCYTQSDDVLSEWVHRGVDFALTLPNK